MNAVWIGISIVVIAGLYGLLFATADALHLEAPRNDARSALDRDPH